jgi:fimbrial chaperone protein
MPCKAMRAIGCTGILMASLLPLASGAQGFAALVSPPRFELTAKAGDKVRQVMEITNAGGAAAKYKIRTADWTLADDGSVKFDEALGQGSCRPWVAIESKQITVPAGGKNRYRFEVSPPADAPVGECRFAIMIEGDEQAVQTPNGPSFPIAGRLGVIVYVSIGEAQPRLEVAGTKVALVNEVPVPILLVKNSGNAHGRITGFLSGTDASGKKIEFTPSTLPILVGETRAISLVPYGDKDEVVKVAFPVTIKGKLEWGDNQSTPFDQTFSR